jgi:hypothetical protein
VTIADREEYEAQEPALVAEVVGMVYVPESAGYRGAMSLDCCLEKGD